MKNILITGASQGIGKATAIEAAKAKIFVGINYNQNAKAADECLADQLDELFGGKYVCELEKNDKMQKIKIRTILIVFQN